jgi:adhesin/invasin
MRTSNRRFASTGLLIMGVTTLVAVGCDKVPLTAPGNSTVTLTTATAASGNVEVVATVLEEGGTPVQDGTTVRFASSLGRMDPGEVHTRNSTARSTFIPNGDSGETTITVSSGTATANVKFNVGLALVDSVSVRASAGSVPATGGTVTITARVIATGGGAMAGVPVTFSTTAGTLSGTRETTDGSGEASTRLTTDANATVTATAGTKSGTVAIQALNPVPTPTITLAAVGGTVLNGGLTPTAQTFTFTATVANNTAVGSPTRFDWTFGDGTTATTNGPSVTHAYSQEKQIFNATVTATFQTGAQATASTDIITADFP